MKPNDILDKIDHQSGMTVPEGYFEDFAQRMAASLPKQPWEDEAASAGQGAKIAPRSFWQKVRPYVYMAAMFAGIWCMMKMFDLMRPSQNVNIGDNAVLAAALGNDAFMTDYYVNDVDDYELLDNLYSEGFQPASLVFN
ncbi:MAG: hypothetical protein LIO90_02965 [Bacteroidales bacterium]|nr:hypothetical protein [Bacteroidales bacterium]